MKKIQIEHTKDVECDARGYEQDLGIGYIKAVKELHSCEGSCQWIGVGQCKMKILVDVKYWNFRFNKLSHVRTTDKN